MDLREVLRRAVEKGRPVLLKVLAEARNSAGELAQNTALMTLLAHRLHRFIPWPLRVVIGRKRFIRFVLNNREALAPLLFPSKPSSEMVAEIGKAEPLTLGPGLSK